MYGAPNSGSQDQVRCNLTGSSLCAERIDVVQQVFWRLALLQQFLVLPQEAANISPLPETAKHVRELGSSPTHGAHCLLYCNRHSLKVTVHTRKPGMSVLEGVSFE